MLWACDVVFGSVTVGLAVLGTVLWAAGAARAVTALLLWSVPVFNLAWTAVTRERDRLRSELLRNVVFLPIATYLYVADAGVLERMWIPSLIFSIGFSLQNSVAAPWGILAHIVTLTYASALFIASTISLGSWDLGAVNHALGVALTGVVLSVVASSLGNSLEETARQRDHARVANRRLRTEMDHRLRMELELNQLHKLEAMGRLAAGVAHEINTPVQFVSDSIEFVREAMPDLLDVVDKLGVVQRSVIDGTAALDAAADAARVIDDVNLPYLAEQLPLALDRAVVGLARVAAIVRSLKEFAHPDSLELAAADLNKAIQSTLTVASNEWKYVAELETNFGELPPVRCFVGELNQAVLNIIVNAGHAIADVNEESTRMGRIRVETLRRGDDVVISIEDTGGGIPEHARARIFDPFFTTKDVGRGTGQGLAIARSVIVDKHHGQLTFETELGKGTTFFIRLPIDGPPPSALTA